MYSSISCKLTTYKAKILLNYLALVPIKQKIFLTFLLKDKLLHRILLFSIKTLPISSELVLAPQNRMTLFSHLSESCMDVSL